MKVRYLLPVVALFGCTQAQIDGWVNWYNTDPEEAISFANRPEIQEELHRPAVALPSQKWDRIAYCESGGNWSYPPVTNRTGTYSGGLMIWQKGWIAYGGQEFASWAYLASKAEQIIVAERILADQGWGAWDCA